MDVIAKIDAQFRALETGDAGLATAAVAPDWTDHESHSDASLAHLRGPALLLAVGAWLRAGLSDLRFVDTVTVADDAHALTYTVLTGTHTGPLVVYRDGGPQRIHAATGRPVRVRQTHIATLRDGDVVTHDAVRDDLGMLGQLGFLPPPPAVALDDAALAVAQEVTEAMRRAAAAVPSSPVISSSPAIRSSPAVSSSPAG